MRYDRNGFPIPPQFEVELGNLVAADPKSLSTGKPSAQTARVGSRKRAFLLLIIAAGLLPAIVIPQALPIIRAAVVEWSLDRADLCEAQNDLAGAIMDINRALDWHGDEQNLLCRLAMLRLEDRDAASALLDANRAAVIAPMATAPLRVRALVHVVLDNANAALIDAGKVVELAARGDPDALTHRAYIRALVGRDLPAALDDINAAIVAGDADSAELLDTRGFILHLMGRHRDAIDELNRAIDAMQRFRRQLGLLADRLQPVELARRVRLLDHGLAVMFHHRALACTAIGLKEQAQQDFEVAKRRGFDPSRGIF